MCWLQPSHTQLTKSEGNVFATDVILSTIMCCTRSSYSWDVVVQKIGDKLFFDKRDDSEFGKLIRIVVCMCLFEEKILWVDLLIFI